MSREEITEPLTLQERFTNARADLNFWMGEYEKGPQGPLSVDCLIAAAQAWGKMCGLVAADPELRPQLDAIQPRLYPSEYPEPEAVPF